MDPLAAATSSAAAVGTIGSHFMLDGATYVKGASLGFGGLDVYITGRAGVLGPVDADVVVAGLAFFEPGNVRTLWEQGQGVMPPADAARAFAACCEAWAEEHVPDDLDAARLADLAGQVATSARSACAPVFAGWRAMPVPESPKAAAVHQMNVLRELRNGLHSAAIVSVGLSPLQAVSVRSPHMVALFGWPEPAAADGVQPLWDDAERRTDAAIAHAYDVLDEAERAELVDLADALHQATKG